MGSDTLTGSICGTGPHRKAGKDSIQNTGSKLAMESSNSGSSTFRSTGGSTLFQTAKSGFAFHVGTGSTLEVSSRDGETIVEISGYLETLVSLDIAGDTVPDEAFHHYGNGYVTVTLQQDYYVSRFELNDVLNGAGWKMAGYTATPTTSPTTTNTSTLFTEIWTKTVKAKPTKTPNSQPKNTWFVPVSK